MTTTNPTTAKAVIKTFDAATYKATVQLTGSLSTYLDGVRVAKHIGAELLTAGAKCAVEFFDPSNPDDAFIPAVYDGVPPAWITTGMIVDATIATGDIADLAITTGKIADLAVTSGKLAVGAVTWDAVSGKPSTFTPAAHALNDAAVHTGGISTSQHGNLTGFTAHAWGDISGKPSQYEPSAHNATHQPGGDDKLAIYTGLSGGQTLYGDTASGGSLTLHSTYHATKGKIYFGTNSMYDQANKYLGLNTTPSYLLHLKSLSTSSYPLFITRSGGTEGLISVNENADGDAILYLNKTGGDTKVQIHSDGDTIFNGGNVGIGATPLTALHVEGTIMSRATVPVLALYTDATGASEDGFDFISGSTLSIRRLSAGSATTAISINASGNTTIAGTLTVNGDQTGATDHVFDDYDDIELLRDWRAGRPLPFATGDLLNRDRLLRDTILTIEARLQKAGL